MSEDERIQEEKEVIVREEISQIEPDEGYDAMRSVTVIISPEYEPESINLQDKDITITENTTTVITPDVGYQGLGEVQITTAVPSSGGGSTLGVLMQTITENNVTRTYTPESLGLDGVIDGWNRVTINTNIAVPRIDSVKTLYITPELNGQTVYATPLQGYSGIESATINVGGISGHLVSDSITPDSSGGTLTLPALNPQTQMYGYAPGCVLNVPSNNKPIISSYKVYFRDSPTGGTDSNITISDSDFTKVTGATLAVQQQYGYVILYKLSNGVYIFGFIVPNSNHNITLPNGPTEFYYYNVGAAKYIYSLNMLDSNGYFTFKVATATNSNVVFDHLIMNTITDSLIGCSLLDSTP